MQFEQKVSAIDSLNIDLLCPISINTFNFRCLISIYGKEFVSEIFNSCSKLLFCLRLFLENFHIYFP